MDGVNGSEIPEPIRTYLDADDAQLESDWQRTLAWLKARFERDPGMEGILFLIGIQSQGRGYQRKLKKEKKQDLIMEGTYCAFETLGIYHRVGADPEGNWIWEPTIPRIPKLPLEQQEKLLRLAVVRYFEPFVNLSEQGGNGAPGA